MTKLVGIMFLSMVLMACACASPTLPQQDAGVAPDASSAAPVAPDASPVAPVAPDAAPVAPVAPDASPAAPDAAAPDHVDLPPVQEEL
jgi:hypothetical protein